MKMKKPMMAAGGFLALVVGGVLVFAGTRPSGYKIERSIDISGSADAIFAKIGELPEWDKWSPWKAKDASMKTTYSGPKSGVGATQSWTSKSGGDGSLKITELINNHKMRYVLTFKDWDSKSDGEFRLDPISAASTRLTWTMEGKNTFVGKVFWVVFGVDKSVEQDFEQGLASIKTLVEQPRIDAANAAAAAAAAAAEAAALAAASPSPSPAPAPKSDTTTASIPAEPVSAE
jgi:hypothetical protein